MNRKERRHLAKSDRHAGKLQTALERHRQGRLAQAEALLRQVLAAEPGHPAAARMLGEVLADQGRSGEAISLLQPLSLQHPGPQVFYSLGNACRLGGQTDAAIAAYQASLRLQPDFAGAHQGLGSALLQAEREAEALRHFREAARLAPGWAQAWKDLGITFAALGELGLAEAALSRAVSIQPSLGTAHRHLAALRQTPADAAELAALAARAGDPALPEPERIEVLFALARLAEKSGAHEDAFRHAGEANRRLRAQLDAAGLGFDQARLSAEIDRIIAAWPRQAFDAYAGGNPGEQTVFIVGMPRAGSTLFEQIVASHPAVFGAGERYAIGAIAQRLGALPSPAWTPEALAAEAAGYLAAMPGDAARVTDKMPDNIFHLGLIAALFPRARVIFCERDPRDLAVSCWFQRFSEPYGFDTDLADIAFRISELERLKAHWLQALPLRCLTLRYEALLQSPEAEARRLIEFLGLEWDEKCLAFHENPRVVRTASWSQVRKPLYADSVGRWRHYRLHLPPQLTALAGDEADAASGAA